MNIPYVFRECTKCGEWLVVNNYNFGKAKRGKWGLKSQCKKCEKEYNKQRYKNNKEHILEHSKEYYKNNKEKRKERDKEYYENNKEKIKEYYENNKEKIKEYNKEYYENNKEKIKEKSNKWVKENREYRKEYHKQWYEDNKEYCNEHSKQWRENNKEKCFNYNNERRSKEKNQGRGITKEQWLEMFKFFDFKCAYSNIYLGNENNKNIRTVDHILALDNGGLNEPWNCVPMVKSYNSSKRNRVDILTWYKEQEYFNEERLNKIVEWQIYAYEKWGGEEFGELILITDLI